MPITCRHIASRPRPTEQLPQRNHVEREREWHEERRHQREWKAGHELRRQEFTFSPDSATFEREEWTICEPCVTHVRGSIKPDKGGESCRAALTSLALMG
jgi:hypothetical protein